MSEFLSGSRVQKDIEYIKGFIANRYPFLMIDRILKLEDNQLKTLKNITINEEYFSGHFPQQAVMPGVLILEGMAQPAGLLLSQRNAERRGYLVGIDKARFRKVVKPGHSIVYKTGKIREKGSLFKVEVRALVDQELGAEAIISLVLK